jgi:ankyrin repeat protein
MSISGIRDPTEEELEEAIKLDTVDIYEMIEYNYTVLVEKYTSRDHLKRILQDHLKRIETLYLKDPTILIYASKVYNENIGTDIIEVLINLNIDVNIKDIDGNTPLYAAAFLGHLEIVKFLVDRGADINIKSNDDTSPLYAAAMNGHLEIVKFLVDRGADINIKKNYDTSPLYAAAYKGHLEIVEFLVNRGADINIRRNNDTTPLYIAAYKGYFKIVQFLVDRGAITTFINNTNGKTALDIAREQNHTDIIRLLEHKDREDVSDKIEDVKITYNPLHKNRPGGKKRTIKNPRNTAKKRKLNKKKTKSKNTRK